MKIEENFDDSELFAKPSIPRITRFINPFRMQSQEIQSTYNQSSLPFRIVLKQRANTISLDCKSTLVQTPSIKIMKPKAQDILIFDDLDELTDDESFIDSIKEETKKYDYRPKMTPEISYNFSVIKSLNLERLKEPNHKMITLPQDNGGGINKKTLIVDLDDTLIHTVTKFFNYSGMKVSLKNSKQVSYKDDSSLKITNIKVFIRPYAIQFLKELSKTYEIIVLLKFIIDFHSFRKKLCRCSYILIRSK